MVKAVVDDLARRMDSTLEALKKDFAGLRTGRANATMLDSIMVDVYGAMMPLNQVGNVSVPEPRMISVSVWDKENVKSVEKAIRDANLGFNPQADGNLVRVPVPPLTEERRNEIAKIAAKFAEQARIAIRNVRRDGMDALKKAEKDKQINEDDLKSWSDKVQKMTDEHIKKVDEALATKEKDIKQV
jgi:ribosome recycling factor